MKYFSVDSHKPVRSLTPIPWVHMPIRGWAFRFGLIWLVIGFSLWQNVFAQSITYSSPIDISIPGISIDASPLDVLSETTVPDGVRFNPNGSKMYVLDGAAPSVFQYDLSMPFDVTSGVSYDGAFDFSGEDTFSRDIAFNSDGTKMFVLGGNGDDVNQYSLATPYDITTGVTFDGTPFSVAPEETGPNSMTFNKDGTKMYIVGGTSDAVNQYSLATPFIITSGVTFDGSPYMGRAKPSGISFNANGTRMFLLDAYSAFTAADLIYQYNLSNPYDITSGVTLLDSISVAAQETSPRGVTFSSDGKKMYITGIDSDAVHQYSLPSVFQEAVANDGTVEGSMIISISGDTLTSAGGTLTSGLDYTVDNLPAGLIPDISVAPDGTTATLTFTGNATNHNDTDGIVGLQFTFSNSAFTGGDAASISNAIGANSGIGIDFSINPEIVYASPVDITDPANITHAGSPFDVSGEDTAPTGIAFSRDGLKMFVTGDAGNDINQYVLTTPFDITSGVTFGINYDLSAEETVPLGITFSNDGKKMFTVGNGNIEVNQYSLSVPYDISSGVTFDGAPFDLTPEGTTPNDIEFNTEGTKMFILGFGGSGQVSQYSLSTPFDITSGVTPDGSPLDISAQENNSSGMSFNANGTKLFIIGSTGYEINQYTLTTPFDITTGVTFDGSPYDISADESLPQDITLSPDGKRLFIVGNGDFEVNQYNLNTNVFSETSSDDGSLQGSMIIKVVGENFTNPGGSLTAGSDYTVDNIPVGLTPNLVVDVNALTAALTFTGTATSNDEVDDLPDLRFTFQNTAILGGNAAAVANAIAASSGLGIDFIEFPIDLGDSSALVELYDSTNGAGWNNSTNWKVGPVETWFGVTVEAGRVTGLDLSDDGTLSFNGNGLNGFIPTSIGDLDFLVNLNLQGNSITGSIPVEIGTMDSLEILNLRSNLLSGSIPTTIGNLASLNYITLAFNQLTGAIPTEIGNLGLLTGLDLGNNLLTGSIPSEIGNLSSLNNLNLVENDLSGGIPPEIGNLSNLTNLDLDLNSLTGSIPVALGNISTLTSLGLSNNQLSGSLPTELGNLVSLSSYLALNNNQFSGIVPASLSNLTSLTTLSLSNNDLDSLPDLSSLSSLGTFDITSNLFTFEDLEPNVSVLTGDLSQNTFGTIDTLNVSAGDSIVINSEIPGLGANDVYQWQQNLVDRPGATDTSLIINSVTLSDNGDYRLKVTNSLFPGTELFSALKTVNVSNSMSDSLALVALYDSTNGDGWTDNTNWKVGPLDTWSGVMVENGRVVGLSFNANFLSGQIPAQIGDLDQLDTLSINQVFPQRQSSIPPELGNLSNLSSLSLIGGYFDGSIPAEIGNLTNLSSLTIELSTIVGTLPPEIGNLTNLIYMSLSLSNSNISGPLPPEIGNLSNLQELFITGDFTGNIPSEIGNLSNLQTLFLNGDYSGNIPSEIGNLGSLISLNIVSSQIQGTIPSTIGNLVNLIGLTITTDSLSAPYPAELVNLVNLTSLSVTYPLGSDLNVIQNIPNLTSLWLYGIPSLPQAIPAQIGDLTSLDSLSLSGFEGSIPTSIGNLTTLLDLTIKSNNLSGTLPVELGDLTSLQSLDIQTSQLSGDVPIELNNLSNLNSLRLENNEFSGLPDFSGLSLSILRVNNNFIDFADLEPNISLPITYAPQKDFGPGFDTLIASSSNLDLTYPFGGSANNYQWYKNGQLLAGETNDTLSILNASGTDNGLYALEATSDIVINLTLKTEYFNVLVEGSQTILTEGPDWSAAFSFGSDKLTSTSAIETDVDGNIFMYGGFNGSFDFFGQAVDNLDSGAYLAKLDPSYNVIWLKHLLGTSAIEGIGDQMVYDMDSSEVYLTGRLIDFYDDGDTLINSIYPGENNYFVLKTDSAGSLIWFKEYPAGVTVNDLSVGEGLVVSGVFNSGLTLEGQALTHYGNRDFFLLYYSLDGVIQFVKSGGGTGIEYHLIADIGNSTIIATAEATSDTIFYEDLSNLALNEGDGNVLVIQYDLSGNKLWNRAYSGSRESFGDNNSWPTSIVMDANENAYIKGWYGAESAWDADTLSSPYQFNKYLALIANNDGAVVWVKSIFEEAFAFDYNEMEVDENNNVYFMAQQKGELFIDGARYPLEGQSDMYVAKFSNSGELDWVQNATTNGTGSPISSAAMGVNREDHVHIGGRFTTANFDLGAFPLSSPSTFNGFLASIGVPANIPPTVADQTFSIPENSLVGTVVDTVFAEDSDSDTLVYTMQSGSAVGVFLLDSLSGELTVLDSTAIDYEQILQFDFVVAVSDGDSTTTANILIDVLPVNEPLSATDSTYYVDQSSPNATSIGFVKAEDIDLDELTYTIIGGNTDGAFAVVDSTGEMTVIDNTVLDYDVTPNYTLGIEVTDGEFLDTASAEIRITSLTRDRLALIAFKDALIDTLDNWGDLVLDNSWEGVEVENGRVRGLRLSNVDLAGNVPDEFLDLTALDTIDLSENQISSFPDITFFPNLNTLNLRNNALGIVDLLVNRMVTDYQYEIQGNYGETRTDTIYAAEDTLLQVTDPGILAPANNYRWFFTPLGTASPLLVQDSTLTSLLISEPDYFSTGTYYSEVTNPNLNDLTLQSNELSLYVGTDIQGTIYRDDQENPLDTGFVDIFRIVDGPFFLEDSASVDNGAYLFKKVVLGDFILKVTPENNPDVLQTYFESEQDWVNADTLFLREKVDSIDILMQFNPGDFPEAPDASGFVVGKLEDGTSSGRLLDIEARRKVKKAGCSLRRRTRSGGGRGEQEEDEFTLVAYVETDDEGNFGFNNIPAGYYRINIQYPGVPMDESSQIEFEIGEDRDDVGFQLNATITEEGIVVELKEILGTLKPYLKNATLYPNPAANYLVMDYVVKRSADYLIMEVIDLNGKTHLTEDLPAAIGPHSFRLDISELASGVYIVRLRNSKAFSLPFRLIKD